MWIVGHYLVLYCNCWTEQCVLVEEWMRHHQVTTGRWLCSQRKTAVDVSATDKLGQHYWSAAQAGQVDCRYVDNFLCLLSWNKEKLIRFWSDLHSDLDPGILFLLCMFAIYKIVLLCYCSLGVSTIVQQFW